MYLMHSCVYILCVCVCLCVSKAVGVVRQRDVAGNFAPDVTALIQRSVMHSGRFAGTYAYMKL